VIEYESGFMLYVGLWVEVWGVFFCEVW